MAGDSVNTGKYRNFLGAFNQAVAFNYLYDSSLVVTNVYDPSIPIGTGGFRPFFPSDFASNISLSGVSINIGAVSVTGTTSTSVTNPTYQVGITGQPISIVGSVTAMLTGSDSTNVFITGSPTVVATFQTSTTSSNSTPSGANGLALSANANRKTWFLQNNATGNSSLFVGLGAQSSTQSFNLILKGASSQYAGDGGVFLDDYAQWRGAVYVSGSFTNYIIWELT